MSTSNIPDNGQSKNTRYFSPWLAYPIALFVWFVIPWVISLLLPRYGWEAGRPSIWNFVGLIPVLIGTAGLLRGVYIHAAQSPQGIEWELDKSYLLTLGMYAFSRNPMYLSELILIAGWVIFYGSMAVLTASVVWFLFFNYYFIPREERVLEAHFGDTFRNYKSRVRRWFGRVRR